GLHGNTPGARVGRLAGDQAGVAGGRGELLEVLLVEGVLHPAVHVPVAVAAEADTEVGQAVPAHVGVDRARGVRREAAAGAAVIGEVGLSLAAQQVRRVLVLEAPGAGPARDAGDPLARDVAVGRAEAAGGARGARRVGVGGGGAAGQLRRARRIREADVLAVGERAVHVDAPAVVRIPGEIRLDATHA